MQHYSSLHHKFIFLCEDSTNRTQIIVCLFDIMAVPLIE